MSQLMKKGPCPNEEQRKVKDFKAINVKETLKILNKDIEVLAQYKWTSACANLSQIEIHLIWEQLNAMCKYRDLLNLRLSLSELQGRK